MAGGVELEIKYGEAKLGTSESLRMDLYESDVHVGSTGQAIIESKYSDLELSDMSSLELTSYEDDIVGGSVSEQSKMAAKYGDLSFASLGDVRIDFYETDLEIRRANNIEGNCKYGQLQLGNVQQIEFHGDYEMEVAAMSCNALILHESKYGDFEIGSIAKSARIQAYETTVNVDEIGGGFESLWIESKYDSMRFPFPGGFKV